MSALTISVIQSRTHWHDPAANRAMFDIWFEEVPDATHLVILPEMFSTGFTMASAEVAEPMNGETVAWMRASAQRLYSRGVR